MRHVIATAFVVALIGYLADGGDAGDTSESSVTSDAPAAASPSPTAASPSPTAASPSPTAATSPQVETSPGTPAPGTALAVLATLPAKGRAPMTGYDRARFGPAWLDADRNGCDTRNDLLRDHLTDTAVEANGCVVTAGTYADPYTGLQIDFVRGHGSLVDIDHVVALGNSWATGAARWTVLKRAAFANDPLNLLPADASANRQKGDGDAATWLPPYRPFRCEYVARQVSVKAKYGLWVTVPERTAVERVLGGCPDQPATADLWGAPTEVDHRITDPGDPAAAPSARPSAQPSARPSTPSTPRPFVGSKKPAPVHFVNCDAARAAGAAPVRSGDPGYGRHLDRDGDGVGCE